MPPRIEWIRRYLAETAVGPSTLRNQGAPGIIRAARKALAEADLRTIARASQRTFPTRLDVYTETIRRRLPPLGRRWGTARKAVNVFLRDALYDTYMSRYYGLSRIEAWLELPLDSYTIQWLRAEYTGPLPRWCGVAAVTQEDYAEFQRAASVVASQEGCERVHLDIKWWRQTPPE